MRKTKIAFASILKPVDEPRMYEKMGLSLDQTNKYEINIIGFSTKNISKSAGIQWHPIYNSPRLSFKRLLAPWKCYRKILKVKPEVIILNTPELLIVIIAYKIIFGSKIIYDIRENYPENIRYTNTYPRLLRPFLASLVRGLEILSKPFIDHYFLAEKSYAAAMAFTRNKRTIIENKFKNPGLPLPKTRIAGHHFKMVYSGTIAENYGILEAIHFAEKLFEYRKDITLTIIGYCAKPKLLQEIKKLIADKPYIRLIGGEKPVPHTEVLKAIGDADVGLVPYRSNKSTDNCFPTKIYEYMAYRLPLILQNNPYWVDFCLSHGSCIPIDFLSFDPEKVLDKYSKTTFYRTGKSMDIYWETEEVKLLQAIENLVSDK
ncbi:glycosyltransferase [Fulvivirgaceae bacterium BMA12]|uniref:Glycosyltransferase n=1 Tax=Agaribacillus aureus TaxID=3051825 RepID=A0ABT8KYX8_9BACT|nr:glycosyltransferase [Fulvivirgaceae bacterium BMA12]